MASLTAVMEPGLLNSVSDGVTLRFTDPPAEASGVKIEIFESDGWTIDGSQVSEGTKDDLCGEIMGDIAARKFKFKTINTYIMVDPYGGTRFMNLPVTVEGETHHVPVQNIKGEKEYGFFEISFKITGTINGQAQSYVSKSPVFCRNIPSPRAEVAFIAGRDVDFADEPLIRDYFQAAARAWGPQIDNRTPADRAVSLESILTYLCDPAKADSRRKQPWGVVNIISHGSADYWFIRKRDSDSELLSLDEAELKKITDLPVPDESVLDDTSIVVVRACRVGNNARILAEIKRIFGGRATIYAPLAQVQYLPSQAPARNASTQPVAERLLDVFRFDWRQTTDPTPAQAEQEIRAEYAGLPRYSSFTAADWRRIAATTTTNAREVRFRERIAYPHPPLPPYRFSGVYDELKVHDYNGQDYSTRNYSGTLTQAQLDEIRTIQRARRTPKSQEQLRALAKSHWQGDLPFDDVIWGRWDLKQVQARRTNSNGDLEAFAQFELSNSGRAVTWFYRQAVLAPGTTDQVERPSLEKPRHFAHSSG